MPSKYSTESMLPGLASEPARSDPPYRDAKPQRHGLLGPDYGERFLQNNLPRAPIESVRTADDPDLLDRLQQAVLRIRQRNATDHARRMAEYIHALNDPASAPESLRGRIPDDPAMRAAALRNASRLYQRLIDKSSQMQRQQDAIPDSDFMRSWRQADTKDAAALAWRQPGAFARDFAAPAVVESLPTTLQMVIAGRMSGGVGKNLGLGSEGQKRAALAGAVAVGGNDGYELGASAEVLRQLRERGIDLANPDALGAALRDRELMAQVLDPAHTAGKVSAAAGLASPWLASRFFAPSSVGPLRRELTNAAVQVPVQATLGGGTEALSQKLVRGEIEWKDVLAAAISPALLTPVDVTAASAGGYRQPRQTQAPATNKLPRMPKVRVGPEPHSVVAPRAEAEARADRASDKEEGVVGDTGDGVDRHSEPPLPAENRGLGTAEESRIPESRIPKIFASRAGHLPDSPENRKTVEGISEDPALVLGKDAFGNVWAGKTLPDGTQIWVQMRNGKVINAGKNTVPRAYNPETGLAAPERPGWKK